MLTVTAIRNLEMSSTLRGHRKTAAPRAFMLTATPGSHPTARQISTLLVVGDSSAGGVADWETLLQVFCRGKCCVPENFAWALVLIGVRQQSRVVRVRPRDARRCHDTRNRQVVQRRKGLRLH